MKEKVPKEGVSPTMALLVIAVAGTAILSLGVTTTPAVVFAQPPSGETPGNSDGHGTPRLEPGQQDDPNCWGDVTRQLVELDDGQGIGDHASSFGEPRDGVGNQDEDTPAQHGAEVGKMLEPDIVCQ